MTDYGVIEVKLNEMLEKRNLSKNKLCFEAQLERKQLNKLCNNEASELILGFSAEYVML